ncbi:hypothetical protein BSZ21_17700 [Bradyrhizobium canariense]|uniref:DUF302 domain-containing protein n=1 Tax=Bradyrhizobium canariense TaxID=255045 RepID=UPI000A1966AD|nr:DUF302 domain-containing protein [Bradyrhizobium canariense]OSI67458.1 hypothetical protein BSZ21_17700 [Bradyrhizobium canariense]
MAAEGLISQKSHYEPKETMGRLESAVSRRGLTIFARVDHTAGAAQVEQSLRPTDLLIFGNAKGGTPVMQAAQTAGIDLPLKVLVWQDANGNTWLSYNDPAWIATRHAASPDAKAAVDAMSKLLQGIAAEVVSEK